MLLKLITILPSLTIYNNWQHPKHTAATICSNTSLGKYLQPLEANKMKPNNEIHTLYVPPKRQLLVKLPKGKQV